MSNKGASTISVANDGYQLLNMDFYLFECTNSAITKIIKHNKIFLFCKSGWLRSNQHVKYYDILPFIEDYKELSPTHNTKNKQKTRIRTPKCGSI